MDKFAIALCSLLIVSSAPDLTRSAIVNGSVSSNSPNTHGNLLKIIISTIADAAKRALYLPELTALIESLSEGNRCLPAATTYSDEILRGARSSIDRCSNDILSVVTSAQSNILSLPHICAQVDWFVPPITISSIKPIGYSDRFGLGLIDDLIAELTQSAVTVCTQSVLKNLQQQEKVTVAIIHKCLEFSNTSPDDGNTDS